MSDDGGVMVCCERKWKSIKMWKIWKNENIVTELMNDDGFNRNTVKVWTNSDKTDDGLMWEKVWKYAECGLHLLCTNQSPHQEKE